MIQILLKDPVIQECRYRPDLQEDKETELVEGQLTTKSALQVCGSII